MAIEQAGPGSVSNSYGARTVTQPSQIGSAGVLKTSYSEFGNTGTKPVMLSSDGTSLVDGAGKAFMRGGGVGAGYDAVGVPITTSNSTISAQSTAGAYTASVVDTVEGPGIRIQGTVVNKYVQIEVVLPMAMPIRQLAVLAQVDCSKHTPLSVYADTDGLYSASTSLSKGITLSGGSPSGSNTALANGLLIPFPVGGASQAWTNTGSLDLDNTLFDRLRIRVTPTSGNFADFTLVKLIANPTRKGRIAIVADDGTKSWYQLGLPLLQARGLVCSMGLITRYIDTEDSLYMTPADVYRAMANGHEVITHGPGNDTGNLPDNFATDAEAVADVVASRQNFINRGFLPTEQQRRCYIWPQGRFQRSSGDTGIVDGLLANGFTLARAATRFVAYSQAVANQTRYGKMVTPIIGHQRGTTSGNEDAENASILAAIDYCAAQGMDGVLMYHKVIPTQGVFAATSATDIEVSRLVSHLDRIQTHIGAGKLENVRFSDLAA